MSRKYQFQCIERRKKTQKLNYKLAFMQKLISRNSWNSKKLWTFNTLCMICVWRKFFMWRHCAVMWVMLLDVNINFECQMFLMPRIFLWWGFHSSLGFNLRGFVTVIFNGFCVCAFEFHHLGKRSFETKICPIKLSSQS